MSRSEKKSRTPASFRLPYPRGLLRWVMRFPILLYRLRLGWLLGKRFLMLEHRGRRSGKQRYAVIEVVDHDPQARTYIVAAAWGDHSDWFQNIQAEPHVHVTVGTKRFAGLARQVSQDEARAHLRSYSARNPMAFRQLASWLVDSTSRKTEEIIEAFVEKIPLVAFSPI